ncbi:MAG TPA: DNA polymerase III subunit alpha [Solirubrobacteraceae bacterium]|nr:DNA polymerase III subunit alpha [Solirubrobacteraceae bacterium]
MCSVQYAELHAHSAFSFLDGASLPSELAAAAVELGYEAVALTDHNGVYGSMEFAQAAQALGLRALHGAEVDVVDQPVGPCRRDAPPPSRHVTLLVRDARGWSNLCRLLTRAHAHTRAPEGGPIVDSPRVTLADLEEHAEGLVCLSGCARDGVRDEPTMRRLLGAFGRDAFRVELQRPFQRHDRALNRGLASLASRLGVPCVATGDVHAHTRERARLQDAFVAVREHTTLDASEPLRRGNHAHVLASPAAMAARFADHPDAVAETARLAATLEFDLTHDLGYRYPGAEDGEADRRLAETCHAFFEQRYPLGDRTRAPSGRPLREEAAERLETELRLIAGLGLSGFFNLHHELLELAREVAREVRGPSAARQVLPPGRGRGSSVSSIVCYLTGLSHVDPVQNELLLGRFLNEEITSLPDIDLDFPRDVREVLLPRIHDRYGRDRSALVAAFPTYKARGAIRELGKALGLPPGEIERVARGSEGFGRVGDDIEATLGVERLGARAGAEPSASGVPGSAAGRDAAGVPGSANARDAAGFPGSAPPSRWAWLKALADEAYGLPRHLSQHSGGMIVSTRPLVDCCPVVPAAMAGRQMVHWDKDSCADAGFLKIDLLGLGMLSAVERCVDHIARRTGEVIDLSRIPFDDPETYAMIQEADTTGVFQIESRAQMASLRRTRPETLEELTIQVAIVRPGPIQGGAVNPYIARRQRLRADPNFQIPYEHPSLEPVLRETLGAIIFQDQVIEVAMAFAGFSPGEAEGLRRAMSRKRSEAAIMAHRERFVTGAVERHPDVDEALAERVWGMVVGFSGFGFPKAHGAAFGLLAYQSTWLRVHHPLEFLCGLLDEQPMGFYPPDSLIHEAQRRGLEVLPPDVNRSDVLCTIESDAPGPLPPDATPSAPSAGPSAPDAAPSAPDALPSGPDAAPSAPDAAPSRAAIRVGLGYVLGVRADEVAALVAARRRAGPFRSLEDLASRAGAGRAALERLAWSGACDALAGDRRTALWQLGVAAPGRRVDGGGVQLSLPLGLPLPPRLRALGAWEEMLADYGTTGVSARVHPLALLRPRLAARGAVTSAELNRLPHDSRVRIGGLVVARQRPGTAKGIVFLLLEDEHGTVNLIVSPDVYERDRLAVRVEPLVVAEGTLERFASSGGAVNVVVRRLIALERPDDAPADVHALPAAIGGTAEEALPEEAAEPAAVAAGGGDFRAVAPPVMSFMRGRSR